MKVEEGQVEMVVAEDGLLEQDMHLELDRHLDAAEVVNRRKYEPPFSLETACSRQEVSQWQVESGLASVANLSISGGEAEG